MPVKRDADGNIIEQPTGRSDAPGNHDRPTHQPNQEAPMPTVGGTSPYNAKTVIAKRESPGTDSESGDARTRIYRPGAPPSETPTPSDKSSNRRTAAGIMEDPPVGWLVVVSGPGQGSVVTIGNGTNSIGRDESERLALDFGDETISRSNHAIITYDPRGRKFYIQHGGGTNLTYVSGQPVLAPQELQPHTNILIGDTALRFVPLCGSQFDWDDLKEE